MVVFRSAALGFLIALLQEVQAQSPFDYPNTTHPVPFNISVHSNFIQDTVARAKNHRVTNTLFDYWTNEGAPTSAINRAATYWATSYDWSEVQREINHNFSHYFTNVPGTREYANYTIPLHFIHERSDNASAIPLLLLHGWPSSHLEWANVVGPLTKGANNTTSFHVVAPDLPGYGFSPAPMHLGLGVREIGAAFNTLMHQLGYDRYGVVGTDLGWYVTTYMCVDFAPNLIGHFTDFFFIMPTANDTRRYEANETTPDETRYYKAAEAFLANHSAYLDVHAQKPASIAISLSDSPVGFLGWVWDLFRTSDDEYPYTYSDLITRTMMLYIPGVYGNIRLYLEIFSTNLSSIPNTMAVPTAVSEWAFPRGPFPALHYFQWTPRSWIERTAKLVFFTRHDTGGHFPAENEPAAWTKDVQDFFGSLS